jgi:hypothetical protein
MQVTHTVADAVRSLTQLGSLLTGSASASAAGVAAGAGRDGTAHTVTTWGVEAAGGGGGQAGGRVGAIRQAAHDAEKEQLRDEVGVGGGWWGGHVRPHAVPVQRHQQGIRRSSSGMRWVGGCRTGSHAALVCELCWPPGHKLSL